MRHSLGLDNVDHVQLTDIDCIACGETFDHRLSGDDLGMVNAWTVEAVTDLECPHCGDVVRWVFEEELLHGCADLRASRAVDGR